MGLGFRHLCERLISIGPCELQARMLLGMSADEVAPLKEAPDPKPYESLLERVAWGEWLLRVQSRTQCAAPTCHDSGIGTPHCLSHRAQDADGLRCDITHALFTSSSLPFHFH